MTALWQKGLRKANETRSKANRSAAARLALVAVLARADVTVSLVEVHGWSREKQGHACLWAINRLEGLENVPYPFADEAHATVARACRP